MNKVIGIILIILCLLFIIWAYSCLKNKKSEAIIGFVLWLISALGSLILAATKSGLESAVLFLTAMLAAKNAFDDLKVIKMKSKS